MQIAERGDARKRKEKAASRSCLQLLFSVEEIKFHQRAELQLMSSYVTQQLLFIK